MVTVSRLESMVMFSASNLQQQSAQEKKGYLINQKINMTLILKRMKNYAVCKPPKFTHKRNLNDRILISK